MARRRAHQQPALCREKRVVAEQQSADPLLLSGCERGFDLRHIAGGQHGQAQTQHFRRCFGALLVRCGVRVFRVDQEADQRGGGDQLVQELQFLGRQRVEQRRNPGQIAAGKIETLHQVEGDRIDRQSEHDRYRRGRRLGGERRGETRSDDQIYLAAHEISCEPGQPIVVAFAPAVGDRDIAALDEAGRRQTLPDRRDSAGFHGLGGAAEIADHRHRRLLRGRGQRCSEQRPAAEDEVAAPHSITSSAAASSNCGTVRPSALAVFRLITSSNLVGCCTGDRPAWRPPGSSRRRGRSDERCRSGGYRS